MLHSSRPPSGAAQRPCATCGYCHVPPPCSEDTPAALQSVCQRRDLAALALTLLHVRLGTSPLCNLCAADAASLRSPQVTAPCSYVLQAALRRAQFGMGVTTLLQVRRMCERADLAFATQGGKRFLLCASASVPLASD